MRLLAINCGNSTLSIALLEEQTCVERYAIGADDRVALDSLDASLGPMGADTIPVVVASVNAPLLEDLESVLPCAVRVIGRDLPIPITNRCRQPATTGHDRLLESYAAGRLHGLPAIVVDFGTALTFNLVDEDGAFLGGAILPGPGLGARSLGAHCHQLPQVALGKTQRFIGRDTEEAIASGILNGYVGLVDHMIAGLRADYERSRPRPGSAEILTVATGGDAHLIAPRSNKVDVIDPDLLLRGISLAFEASLAL